MEELDLTQLNAKLLNNEISSLELVKYYLNRIEKYDGYLKAVGEINPDILQLADNCDVTVSKVAGIPIIVKDNINTKDKMHTSAGSLSLAENMANYESTVTKKLKEAGMLILGKANLSEFAYFESTKAPCGFSSKFGQCKSPYREDIDPLGSSTGSAVAVAANLIPVSIGTETNGSLMSPAMANSIVSLKPTLGMVSRYGILPITSSQDSAGPMSTNVKDSAIIMDIIYGKDINDPESLKTPKNEYHFEAACDLKPNGLKIGYLNFEDEPNDEYSNKVLNEAKDIFEKADNEVVSITIKSRGIADDYEVLAYEFRNELNAYLASVENSQCKSLSEIIEFNKQNLSVNAPYGQDILEYAESTKGDLTNEKYLKALKEVRSEADRLNEVMDIYQLDALMYVNPISLSAEGGYPSLAVPACNLNVDEPYSLIFLTRKWHDELLFTLASYYESKTNYRKQPEFYKKHIK